MLEKKQIRIELTGEDAERIVREWVEEKMLESGYVLDYMRNEEGPWPDTFWGGEESI